MFVTTTADCKVIGIVAILWCHLFCRFCEWLRALDAYFWIHARKWQHSRSKILECTLVNSFFSFWVIFLNLYLSSCHSVAITSCQHSWDFTINLSHERVLLIDFIALIPQKTYKFHAPTLLASASFKDMAKMCYPLSKISAFVCPLVIPESFTHNKVSA